jgi:hypothetical protein
LRKAREWRSICPISCKKPPPDGLSLVDKKTAELLIDLNMGPAMFIKPFADMGSRRCQADGKPLAAVVMAAKIADRERVLL